MSYLDDILNNTFQQQRNAKILYKKLLNPNTKGQKCFYPNCSIDAIRSHSISRNILEYISTDKHIIFPVCDPCDMGKTYNDLLETTTPNISFEKVGINIAGVFRGFCSIHDNNLFKSLDDYGIKNDKDIFLQLYRTVMYYFFDMKMVEKSELQTYGFENDSNSKFEKGMYLSLEDISIFLLDLIHTIPNAPLDFNENNTYLIKGHSTIINKDIALLYKKISNKFNLALENNFILNTGNRVGHCIIIVLPGKDYSNLVAISLPEIIDKIFTQKHLGSDIRILNLIESFLIYNSRFYLNPDVIKDWNGQKLETVINDYFFFAERTFLQEYDISIFDNLRKEFIINESSSVQEHELQKIRIVPKRDLFSKRFENWGIISLKDKYKKIDLSNKYI